MAKGVARRWSVDIRSPTEEITALATAAAAAATAAAAAAVGCGAAAAAGAAAAMVRITARPLRAASSSLGDEAATTSTFYLVSRSQHVY